MPSKFHFSGNAGDYSDQCKQMSNVELAEALTYPARDSRAHDCAVREALARMLRRMVADDVSAAQHPRLTGERLEAVRALLAMPSACVRDEDVVENNKRRANVRAVFPDLREG